MAANGNSGPRQYGKRKRGPRYPAHVHTGNSDLMGWCDHCRKRICYVKGSMMTLTKWNAILNDFCLKHTECKPHD